MRWETVPPEEAGFAADLDARLDLAREAGLLPNVHAVVATRGGRIFCERYWPGFDSIRGTPTGPVRPGPGSLHDLRSCSKSVVGLLYGIALARGMAPSPETALLDLFPEYGDLASDPARRALTVRHALTMTLGLEWDEMSLPYFDPRNSEIAMDNAPDPDRYVLERPVVAAPGTRWIYCGGATALLARLIARGSGQSLADFSRAALFDPLGIEQAAWITGARGEPMAASGLRLTARDMARIGALVLNEGRFGGQQVVPRQWIEAALVPAIAMPDGRHYGYQWYLGRIARPDRAGGVAWEPLVFAAGYGGQRIMLVPALDLSLAITAGNYDTAEHWRPPIVVLRDVLMPAFGRLAEPAARPSH
jgi:CubicO group peptidase (beta-lactamase class C family)